MKLNTEELAEVRSTYVDSATQQIFARQRALVISGDKDAVRELSNALLDELAEGTQLGGLLKAAFDQPAELAGKAFVKVMRDVAWKLAEEEAEAQADAAERERFDDS